MAAALAAHAQAPFESAVMISDGLETAGDTARALHAMREARVPLQWIAVGRPPPETRVSEVLAPDRVMAGQRIQITVALAGRLDRPLRVNATARAATGETQVASAEPDGDGRAIIELDARRSGAVVLDVALTDPRSKQTLDAWRDAAVIDVAPSAAILYVQGSRGPLARSLLAGGWTVNVVPASRLDVRIDGLNGYQAVVLDDVAISDGEPAILEFAGVRRAEPRPRTDGAGWRAVICPRRISTIRARVDSACIVRAGGARSAREHRVRRRQVGQHGPRPAA